MRGVGFEFPVDASGQWDGFNDPGIEHFTGNRLQHLGREVPQNTMDAKRAKPARLRIALVRVPSNSLPDHAGLATAISRCRSAAAKDKSDKAPKFFDDAARLLSAKDLVVLQISDSNTTGLCGPCENGTPFFAMLKATGQSQKPGTSTGSYGIGKFAPFAVSELRTVFVSTVWKDAKGELHHYVQGKSVLMSHLDDTGQTRRGTGYWGRKKGCLPLTELSSAIPEWLRMTNADGGFTSRHRGTMLSIVGFTATKGWQHQLAANIIENFFGAIWRGDLEVDIKDGPRITAATLNDLFKDTSVRAAVADQPGEPDRFDHVATYLAALKGGAEVEVARTENFHLGACELRILVGENLPKRVAVLRNGMLITEGLPGLKRFSDFKEFSAVLECTAEKGLALLRAMEPPRHDAFEPDRLAPDRRHAGRTALRELAEWVRKMLIRHAKDPVQEETNVDELANYFADEEEEGEASRREENPGGKVVFRARAIKVKSHGGRTAVGASAELDEDGDSAELGPSTPLDERNGTALKGASPSAVGESDGDTPGAKSHAPDNGAQALSRRMLNSGLPLADVRAVPLAPTRRRVAFTPAVTGELVIELQDSGTDTNYALEVATANVGTVDQGRISRIAAHAGVRIVIDVELRSSFEGTLRVVANAI
jgi:hypothetical protein